MDLNNILAISGKPDLSELIARTKSGAVVMNLVTGQKYSVFTTDRISSLGEIRIFTDNGETPLEEVMQKIYTLYEGKATAFEPKKESSELLFAELAKALPDYDKERVHASDVKKLFSWYNVLLAAGKLTPDGDAKEEPAKEAAPETAAKATAKKAAPQKAAAPKTTAKPKAAPKRTTTAKKAI